MNSQSTARQVLAGLRRVARRDKAEFLPGFFQAVPGGYGEGDQFLGCVVPDQRKVARQFRDLPRPELETLLASSWHECRLTGMFILVGQYERTRKSKDAGRDAECRGIVDFYLDHLESVNNWDIVDATAPKILGPWLVDHPRERKLLDRLAESDVLWERRVAVLATYALIKNDEFTEIVALSKRLMNDPHDLMHKAVGWMLREMGKRDQVALESFLQKHASRMPRTMLRYAIEKLPQEERAHWLNKRS